MDILDIVSSHLKERDLTVQNEPHNTNEDNVPKVDLENHSFEKQLVISNELHLFDNYTKAEQNLILENVVKKLNNGETLYDISKEFVRNRKLRAPFATKLQLLIEHKGYFYNKKSKLWSYEQNNDTTILRNEETNLRRHDLDIEEVVSFLNKESSFRKVEVEFGIKNQELRLLLKNKGYRYDGFLKIWTNKERNDLMREISDNLEEGLQFFSERKVDIITLTKEIEELRTFAKQMSGSKKNDLEDVKIDTNYQFEEESLTADEIRILRDIMLEWKDNNSTEISKILTVAFRLDQNLLKKLDNYAELNNISKSMAIEKALNFFFENQD